MFVIGVAGQAQMGKDTLSDYLATKLNEKVQTSDLLWQRTAFADNVKKVYQDTFGKDRPFVEEWKVKPECPPGFTMNVRKSLQFIGDGFRQICPTIWLDLVFRRATSPIIISDVRYVNEFLRVKQEGGLNILIGRPDKLNDDPNGSEAQIRPYVKWCLGNGCYVGNQRVWQICFEDCPLSAEHMRKFDLFVRNDGTIEDLYRAIDNELIPFIESFVFQFPEQEILEPEMVLE